MLRAKTLISVTAVPVLALALTVGGTFAQETRLAAGTAADAAYNMAMSVAGAAGGISSALSFTALEEAAKTGQPSALFQLALAYESGDGVAQDRKKAFNYFSQIANEHADTSPRSLEASIVAQSFIKVGEYYSKGVPEAGVPQDTNYANRLMMHAASYFGDMDAQYLVGLSYLEDEKIGANSLQSARWFGLAAQKGHAAAQAQLGRLLFNGIGMEADPVEGLMWLTMASRRAVNTADQGWIDIMLNDAMSVATPEQRLDGIRMADTLNVKFGGLAG